MRPRLLALTSLMALALATPGLAGGPVTVDPEPAPTPPAAPAAFDWSGPYVGLGYGGTSGDFDVGPLDFPPIPANLRPLSNGSALSLYAGYLYQRGSLVYGGELAISELADTRTPMGVNEEVGQIIDLKGRAGFAGDRVLVYGVLGYSSIAWDSPGEPFTETGPSFGFGIDYAASDRLMVGLEYLARRTSGRFDPPGRDFDLNVDTLSLRIGYRF